MVQLYNRNYVATLKKLGTITPVKEKKRKKCGIMCIGDIICVRKGKNLCMCV